MCDIIKTGVSHPIILTSLEGMVSEGDEVVAYADKRNLMYSVQPPKDKIVRPKAYAANFSVSRKVPSSH